MKPPLPKPTPRTVYIKPQAPIGLLTAFAEEQWTTAASLAKQCHRTTKDNYYLAVEIASKSQSDNVADNSLGRATVETMIKENTIITDVDALDLYEFSCTRLNMVYSETIGLLRARLVKARPKDQAACTRCFDACVWNWDWKNAQQIAASLNKNFPNDRRFLLRNILATHQYSISNDCPEGTKRIFASLAKAQADKGINLRAVSTGNISDINESEALLWLDIRMVHCSLQENMELFRKPEYNPVEFLKAGHRDLFGVIVAYLVRHKVWFDIMVIAKAVLEEAIRITEMEVRATKKGDKNSLKKHPVIAASCDYALLSALSKAAATPSDRQRILKLTSQLIDKLRDALIAAGSMQPIFRTTQELINLGITLERDSQAVTGTDERPSKSLHLADYIVDHYDNPLCLTKSMELIKGLTPLETGRLAMFLYYGGIESPEAFERVALISLHLKLRYTLASTNSMRCHFCYDAMPGNHCVPCLRSIASQALSTYKSGIQDASLVENIQRNLNVNPLSDLAVVGAISLLRLAGLNKSLPEGTSPLHFADHQSFLQAVVWLDSCLHTSPPKNNAHGIILTKLYLLLGCVSKAKGIWDRFDVKNALLDSLALLYVDRLSTIAPGLFMGSAYNTPISPIIVHFSRALQSTAPNRIKDALDMGAYTSVLDMVRYAEKQFRSCTLAFAVIERRRGARVKGGRPEASFNEHPLARNLKITHSLEDTTDYASFADILPGETSKSNFGNKTPLHRLINHGPLPSTIRAHLGLLSEHFFDTVSSIQAKEYKPSKASHVLQLEWQAMITTFSALESQMALLLTVRENETGSTRRPAKRYLTLSETYYHTIIWKLTKIVQLVFQGIFAVTFNDTRDSIRSSINNITSWVETQTTDFSAVPENNSKADAFYGFAALHSMGMLRETILAVRQTVTFLAAASERAKNTDKTRASLELAWLAPELKKMTAAATVSENTIKARIKSLRDYLDNADGWSDRFCDLVLAECDTTDREDKKFKDEFTEQLKAIIPKSNIAAWADEIGGSWREVIKGWTAVKFD
ncbi:hypothetical protein M426DRAFT_318967 [Hypoxylon sp. CI-4A]|nr:hypothetical protein M426DRAFT_318967 [Hypoxylon sp. CI-4A]